MIEVVVYRFDNGEATLAVRPRAAPSRVSTVQPKAIDPQWAVCEFRNLAVPVDRDNFVDA
jgi:hypothetical protein